MAIKNSNTEYYSPSNSVGGSGITNHLKALKRVGKKFGMLTAVKHLGSNSRRLAVYECRCDCGSLCIKTSIALLGKFPNCGCDVKRRQAESHLKHGGSRRSGKDKIYQTWLSMNRRCNNKNSNEFKWYGGKGVKVCDRWRDYAAFRDDMLPTYKPGLTIERKDSSKDYSPENCEWITREENSSRAAKQRHKKIHWAGVVDLAHAEAVRIGRDFCRLDKPS